VKRFTCAAVIPQWIAWPLTGDAVYINNDGEARQTSALLPTPSQPTCWPQFTSRMNREVPS
jgi:hypothetical protein